MKNQTITNELLIEMLKDYIESKQLKENSKKRYFYVLSSLLKIISISDLQREYGYVSIRRRFLHYYMYKGKSRTEIREIVCFDMKKKKQWNEKEERIMKKRERLNYKKRHNETFCIIRNFLSYVVEKTGLKLEIPKERSYKIKAKYRSKEKPAYKPVNTQVKQAILKYLSTRIKEKEKDFLEEKDKKKKEKIKKSLIIKYQDYVVLLLLSSWYFSVEEIINLKWKNIVVYKWEKEYEEDTKNKIYSLPFYTKNSYIRRPFLEKGLSATKKRKIIEEMKKKNIEYQIKNKRLIRILQEFRYIKNGKWGSSIKRYNSNYILSPISISHISKWIHTEEETKELYKTAKMSKLQVSRIVRKNYLAIKKIKENYIAGDKRTKDFITRNEIRNIKKLPDKKKVCISNLILIK